MGIIFPCFLYEDVEALVKTSLVILSDRRQARPMDKLFKKILENKDYKLRNLMPYRMPSQSVITSERHASSITFSRQRLRNSLIVFEALS